MVYVLGKKVLFHYIEMTGKLLKKLDWRDWHAFIEPWEGSQLVFVSGQLLICQRLGIGNS